MMSISPFKRVFNIVRVLNNSRKWLDKMPLSTMIMKNGARSSGAKRNLYCSFFMCKQNKKITSKKDKDNIDDDDFDYESNIESESDSKVVKSNVNSLRVDAIIKAGLNIARNKIENMFYESRIRVNGLKINKKSLQLNEGDEIDIIRDFSQNNPSHLIISRIILLSAVEREDSLNVQLRRYKTMLIENYSGSHAHKSSTSIDKDRLR